MSSSSQLTHIDHQGNAQMVDVTDKVVSHRTAVAQAEVSLKPETLKMLIAGSHKKGDVLAVARVAGIQAAKRCSDLIPLCHPLALTSVKIEFVIDEASSLIVIQCACKLDAKTGVEMEALTGVNIAALTIYDMCKAVEKGIVISNVKLIEKTGGKSGDWLCQNSEQGG